MNVPFCGGACEGNWERAHGLLRTSVDKCHLFHRGQKLTTSTKSSRGRCPSHDGTFVNALTVIFPRHGVQPVFCMCGSECVGSFSSLNCNFPSTPCFVHGSLSRGIEEPFLRCLYMHPWPLVMCEDETMTSSAHPHMPYTRRIRSPFERPEGGREREREGVGVEKKKKEPEMRLMVHFFTTLPVTRLIELDVPSVDVTGRRCAKNSSTVALIHPANLLLALHPPAPYYIAFFPQSQTQKLPRLFPAWWGANNNCLPLDGRVKPDSLWGVYARKQPHKGLFIENCGHLPRSLRWFCITGSYI